MRYGQWLVLLLSCVSGCAGPQWVAQPTPSPMESVVSPSEDLAPIPVDTLSTLLDSPPGRIPAKAKGQVLGSTLVYPVSMTSVYPVTTRVHHTTTLVWPMGEALRGDITGGTQRIVFRASPEAEPVEARGWLIAQGESGEGPTKRLQVDITPLAANLHTTMVVRTTRGFYVLEVKSTEQSSHPIVVFASTEAPPRPAPREAFAVPTTGSLGVGYEVLTVAGRVPSWTPTRIWDDQALTIFQFSQALAQGEAPELYSVTPEGHRALVNTSPKGQQYLIAHRLAAMWHLKLGATIVQVRRTQDYRVASCPDDDKCPVIAQRFIR